jgi:hypothetical protein
LEDNVVAELRWLYERELITNPHINKKIKISNPQHDEEIESSIHHALGLIGVMFGVDFNRVRDAARGKAPRVSDEGLEELMLSLNRMTKPKNRRKTKENIAKAVESEEFLNHVIGMIQHQTRMFSIELREIDGLDAYPLLSANIPIAADALPTKADVVRIALNSLPSPDESTPWEQIMEYRSDPDSQSKFLALRHWMSEVARAQLSPSELEEKLEYLIEQYRQHMKLHRMKTNIGTLETVVTTSAEVLGDLVSFKWGKAAEALFSLKRRREELLEGELTSPGNEVAYIVKARETFNAG